ERQREIGERTQPAMLDRRDDRDILELPDGQRLVAREDGTWYLRDRSGLVRIEPQQTSEWRTPQWNSLSNGGRVTFHEDGRTEIASGSYRINVRDGRVQSVEQNGRRVEVQQGRNTPAGGDNNNRPRRLETGDRLEMREDGQRLTMPGGEALTVREDGTWYLRDGNGLVRVENQHTLEIRNPQWNSLSNGGRVTFHPDRTEITMPDGSAVNFSDGNILSVQRGGRSAELHHAPAAPSRPAGPLRPAVRSVID
ncbi:MAG: hypothetical protein K2Z81_17165, partial [Cyanobacteria bacterium]|nr:hypothetical protein [Cyanobacteriota bacterium]